MIDFAAAFDTVSWSFMTKVLEHFNFGTSIRKWISLFYTNTESCVIVNGHMSDWFFLQRGCRQGDALSPYLFILCAEILSILIRNNSKIKGININGKEYKISQYADDTTLTLDGSNESLSNTMQVLKFYGKISGLNINTDKTKVIWFGSRKNSPIIMCPEYNLSWDNTIFTVLGVKFSTNLSDMVNINYDNKIEEIKNMFLCWSKRNLSPVGRLVVIKTLALAKLNHLIMGIPNPPQAKINAIQNLFYKFLWNNSNDKVKREIIIQEYKFGGLKMIDIQTFMSSLKLTWLKRLQTMNDKFSHLVESVCPALKHIYKYGTDYIKHFLKKYDNQFWKDTLCGFCTLSSKVAPINSKESQLVNLWYNPNIKVGGHSICYKKWLAAGIIFIGDLISINGDMYSFKEFTTVYNIKINFLEYNGLIRAVKQYFCKIKTDYIHTKSYNTLLPLILTIINKDEKGCKSVYKQILNQRHIPKSFQKWKEDLDNICELNIHSDSIYNNVFKVTKDTKLIWFQYRINHRIIGTNYLLKKMMITTDDRCTFCNNCTETILHLFWNCNISKQFWNDLCAYINDKINTNITDLDVKAIIFGSQQLDSTLNTILLQAKYFLYCQKMRKQKPSIEIFKKKIISNYQVDRLVAIKHFQLNKFNAAWEKYKNLI